ncbi:MAG: 2OG-Fe(II) oxygenase family protein, partial [Kiloniellales bacterium]|nr:2OG-Fe(II) oxygenase family protein [Kiloniellales bacterium]
EENLRKNVTPLGDMALHHHTDAGALTLLLQDGVGGLQCLAEGEWLDIEPVPESLVVNIGDLMQVWSNDVYRSALHRVRPIKAGERLSAPYFYNPRFNAEIAPLKSVAGTLPHYRPFLWHDFRKGRTDGDFADYGHEIQISDFLIDPNSRVSA